MNSIVIKQSFQPVEFKVNRSNFELSRCGVKEGDSYTGSREVINGIVKDAVFFQAPDRTECIIYVSDIQII